MKFITIDDQPPVNLDRLKGFLKVNNSTYDIKFYETHNSYWYWEYKSKEKRDKAFNFIVKNTCIQYRTRDKIKEMAKRKLKEFVDLVRRRRKPFGNPMICGKEVTMIEYRKHTTSIVNNEKNKKLSNWKRAVQGIL